MDCKSIQELLLEMNPDSTVSGELMIHLESCASCQKFYKQIQSVDIELQALKNSKPVLEYPDSLTNQIMKNISTASETHESFFEKVQNYLTLKYVRLALYSVIVIFTLGYFYEESTALSSVIALESKLNAAGSQYNASLSANLPSLSFLYDVYKLLDGEKKHLNLTDEWLVVNKTFLKKIFVEYDSLSPLKKKELEELRKTLTKEQNEFVDELIRDKNKSLK